MMDSDSAPPLGQPPSAPAPLRSESLPDSRDVRPTPHRPRNAPANPEEGNVLGVFGISIRTVEQDLEAEFGTCGRVEKVVIVYDQRSARSRGFGFVTMSTTEEAKEAIEKLNGVELHGRRIRVDFSVTKRPHDPTPGRYMGEKEDSYRGGGGYSSYDRGSSRYDRDRDYRPRPRYDDYDRHDRRNRDYDDRDRRRERSRSRERYSRHRSRSPRGREPLPEDRR